MNILLRCVVTLTLLALTGCATSEGAGADVATASGYQRTDQFLRDRMSAAGVPGGAYAIVDREGIRHVGAFGTDGNGGPVTAQTPFLWGSVAKPVTATLVAAMVESGELRLEEPVTTYLPTFRTRDRAQSARITVRQLLNQTSGLPTSTRYTDRTDPERRPMDVLPELANESLDSEPGAVHHYSSTNYLLLAAIVEAVTGEPFPEVLRERLLDPLGMRTAVTTEQQARDTVPRGHRYVFGRTVPFAAPFDPAGLGYGYLGGSIEDLAAFARGGLGGRTDVVGDHQRESMFRGDIETSPGKSYGLGWRRWTVAGTEIPMVWHGGAAPGYSTQVILLPDHAVVLTVNAYGTLQEPRLLDIGFGLAATSLGVAAPATEADHTYPMILTALSALAALLVGLAARTLWLLTRPGSPSSGRVRLAAQLAAWLLPLALLVYLLGVAAPAHLGVELPHVVLWAPDIAGLGYAIAAAAAVLAVLRIILTLKRGIRSSGGGEGVRRPALRPGSLR
ncbi:serine hydrolase domain-containing protein [Nocardia sp. NPDC050717]|uniref:serine hydrolase domain-containing protein n=1 Tax=Nocardia sp. NPDC050717 TaxID=3157221 RepID=UPI0033E8C475